MAEVINTNVFDAEKKFVDFAGLDYFWEKAKTYVDDADGVIADKVTALEGVVGDNASGLVKDLADLKETVDALGEIEGGEGLGGMIDAKIGALDVEDVAVDGQYVSSVAEVDGKVVVTRADLPVYEEVGVAAGLNDAMDARVKVLEAIDHDKIATEAAAAAVAGVIDGAPEKFDTLKEIAAWIADADTADDAASLVTRVTALEAIDHDAYKDADESVLASAKSYADGLASNYDAAGAAATAKSEAIADADSKLALKANTADVYVKDTVDAKVSAAKSEAIAQAKLDAAEALKAYYTKEEANAAFDAKGSATTAQTAAEAYAKTYTDQLYASFKFAANSDIDSIFA